MCKTLYVNSGRMTDVGQASCLMGEQNSPAWIALIKIVFQGQNCYTEFTKQTLRRNGLCYMK